MSVNRRNEGNMNPTTTVRRATFDDTPAISEMNRTPQKLHADAYPHLFKQPDAPTFPVDEVKRLMNEANYVFFIAKQDDISAGYLYAEIVRHPESVLQHARNSIHIHQIAVDPAFQSQGVGAALIEKTKDLAKSEGISVVNLTTWEFNKKAQRFFAKQGFATIQYRMQMSI